MAGLGSIGLILTFVLACGLQYAEGYDQGMASVRAAREFSSSLDRLFNETLLDLRDEQDALYAMRRAVSGWNFIVLLPRSEER